MQTLRGGGAETFVRELIPRLRQRKIDARVLCGYGDSQLTEAETLAWSNTVYYLERSGVSRLRYLERMRRMMRSINPDIVHTHTQVGASWGRTAATLARVRLIVHTEHRSGDILSSLERAAMWVLNRRTNAIITFSERSAALVRRRQRIRDLVIIPNGVQVRPAPTDTIRNIARQKLGFDKDSVVLGMIANLHPHKNPSLALEALARLTSQARPTVRLAVFGDGPLRDDLMIQAKKLGVEGQVRFYGFRSDVEELLPGLDVVLSTSFREMMPLSLLESMNAALPVIGVPHAGTLDLVVDGKTGIVLRSWDPDLMAQAIDRSLRHPEWRIQAGNAAYARLRDNYDIEQVTDRYADLYDQLLDRNARSH